MSDAAPPRAAVADLLGARALALYLLSFSALANVRLAWADANRGPASLAPSALVLALALLIGEGLTRRLGALDRARRARAHLVVALLYNAATVFCLVAVVLIPDPSLMQRAAGFFGWLQPAFLLLAGFGRGHLGAIQNALLLVILTALRGGTVAAVAVTAYVACLAFFLVFDHFIRKLGAYPVGRRSWLRLAFSQATAQAAPVVGALMAFFIVAPPAPYVRLAWEPPAAAAASDATVAAYRLLAFLGLGGAVAVYMVTRYLRRGPKGDPSFVEILEPGEVGDEAIEEPPKPRAGGDESGPRGRIVRAYLGFLARAERSGWKRPPSATAREFAYVVGEPAAPLRVLTDLFMRARYGPDEPGEVDVAAAESAAQAVAVVLRDQRPRRSRAGR